MYQTLKRYLWPHTLGPLAVIILIDYVRLLGTFTQVLLGVYLALQSLALLGGFAAAAAIRLNDGSPWQQLFQYNISKFFPLLEAGRAAFNYLMTERPDAQPPTPDPDDDQLRHRGDAGGAARAESAAPRDPLPDDDFVGDEDRSAGDRAGADEDDPTF